MTTKGQMKPTSRVSFTASLLLDARVCLLSRALDAALALHLRVGDLNDPLKGVKSMTDAELERTCAAFSARDLFGLVKAGRDRLLASVNTVREIVNSKFCLDEACTMSFADLDTYYNGSEAIIGAPNPNVDIG